MSISWPHNHSGLTIWEIIPERTPPEMPIQTISYCLTGLREDRNAIDVKETRGYHHLSPNCHPWIAGLKVIGVLHQQPHQCCHCQTGPKAPSVPGKVDDVGRPEPTWKLIYPSLKMRMQRMLWPTRVGGGIWQYTTVQDAEIVPSSHMPSSPYRVIPEN